MRPRAFIKMSTDTHTHTHAHTHTRHNESSQCSYFFSREHYLIVAMPAKRRGQGEFRGGHRRLGVLEADSAPSTRDLHSPLARFLLRSFFLGDLCLPIVVTSAGLALSEPLEHRHDLENIAALGSLGALPNIF